MKNRLLQSLLSINFLLLFISSTLFASLSPLILNGTAFAAGETYLLAYPDDAATKGSLSAAAQDGGIGSTDAGGVLAKTSVFTQGGRLGTKQLTFNADFSNKNDIPTYSLQYYCYPLENKLSTDAPDNSKPYVRMVMGVALGANKNWKSIVTDKTVTTTVGVIGNTNIGTIHYPQKVPSAADAANGVATRAAKDVSIPGKGGNEDIRTAVENGNGVFDASRDGYSLSEYGNTGGKTDVDMITSCMPNPKGNIGKATAVYANAAQGDQDGWDTAIKSAGIGDSATAAAASAGDAATGSSDDAQLQCNVTFNPLTWLMCPIVKGLVTIVDQLDDLITSQLSVGSDGNSSNPSQIFCPAGTTDAQNPCMAYNTAWASFRNIALGLLVIIGLIVVIAQALGSELLDAYTIRKILPRLLISAVAITLSWQLMQFFVTLTNDLGYGIRYLIYQPFTGIGGSSLGGGGVAALALIGGGAIAALSIIGLLSFAATAALAVAIAFLVLVIRQLLVIVLIVLAPIAILAYILPNTQNVYKIWWDSFAKALLMFPIIAAFIATGHVFSVVANASGSALGQLVGFVAYFAPYFLLPLVFRFAGGALRNIGGFVNDRGRGGFDRLRNYRGKKAQSNMAALAAGNRYRASNPVANAINRSGRFAANAGSAGVTPWKMRSRYQAGMSQAKMSQMSEYMEKSAAFKAMSGNDDYLQATMKNMGGGDTEDDWRTYLRKTGKYDDRSIEQGVAAIRAAKRDTNDEVFKNSAVMANASTGTGWKEGGIAQMLTSINEATGGDRDMANRMLAQMRGSAERSGRIDLAGAGFGGQSVAMQKMYEEQAANGSTSIQTQQRVSDDLNEAALLVKGPGAIAQGRGDSAKILAPQMARKIDKAHTKLTTALRSNNPEAVRVAKRELAQEYATVAVTQAAMANAAPENARIWANSVMSVRMGGEDGQTVAQHLEELRRDGDPDFIEASRDFEAIQMNRPGVDGRTPPPGAPEAPTPPGPAA